MNVAGLLQHFERISEAPDAVPRLRRFILDLAVRGKLVEQDPKDEPAAELLKRIRAQKKARIGRRSIAEDIEAEYAESEAPFEIPESWDWVRATEPAATISDNGKKVQTKDVLVSGAFPVVDQGKIFIRGYCDDASKVIHVKRPIIAFGDHTRETKLIDFDFVVGADGVKLLEPIEIDPAYYFLALQWLPLDSRGYGRHFKVLRASLIPLPPVAEQHRIVAKVDELMALCDRLETAQAERESRRDRLVAASLHRLSNGADAESFREHARLFLRHLPLLTTRPEQIQQLRQTVLNLAVRGRLVPQDFHEEPAADLLARIAAEKARLVKEGQSSAAGKFKALSNSDAPFAIPKSWVWVPFGKIMISRDGERIPVSKEERSTRAKIYDYYGASGVIDKIDAYLFDKPLLLIGEDGANLINRSTPIAFIARGKYWVNNHAHVLDGISEEFLRFLELHINAIDLKPYVTGTAQPKMNQAKMNSIAIALPPQAEQHRIVAKVDELMALCERLKAQLTAAQTESRRLLEATLADALSGNGEILRGELQT